VVLFAKAAAVRCQTERDCFVAALLAMTSRCGHGEPSEATSMSQRIGGMRFHDKVALITAAASGIGRATADIIAREGGIVVAVDNHEERLDRTVAQLNEAGGRAHRRLCNALDAADVDATVGSIAQEFGRLDILVNAVGGSTIIAKSGAAVDELSFAEWRRLIDFNLSGTFLFTHAVVPVMKRQKSGKIVNLASIAGRGLSESSSSAYATAKGGIIAFTRKLAFELGPFGITINAIAPSRTLTERIRPRWEQQSPEDQQAEIQRTPLRRIAEAPDQAKVICFLASSDADFVTGVTIDVTGGN
jgi:NAD(P)-dependent dehydrogenase (short-subunit alcohol dehydrogenase family)